MLSSLLILALAPQFLPSAALDTNGDYIGPTAGQGTAAVGDVLQTLFGGYPFGNSGMARNGTTLAMNGSNDGAQVIYLVDEATGASLGTIPVLSDFYYGLGYDASRDVYICTDSSSNLIETYSPSGTLVGTFTAPSSRPVGAAWDSTRDLYWISDWPTDSLRAMDPVTGATVMVIDASAVGADRISDCAYLPGTDMVIVGSRTAGKHFAFNAATGAFIRSFNSQGNSGFFGNDPSGICTSTAGNLWQSQTENNWLTELDLGGTGAGLVLTITGTVPGSITLDISGGTPGGITAFVYGPAGSFTVQNGPCVGLVLDIGTPIVGPMFATDASGNYTITTNLPPGAAGVTVQVVDVAACVASNAEVLL